MWKAVCLRILGAGLVLVVWDEGDAGDDRPPFYAFGPTVKPGHESNIPITHRSVVRTIDEIFGLPILPSVHNDPDLADFFAGDHVPTAPSTTR